VWKRLNKGGGEQEETIVSEEKMTFPLTSAMKEGDGSILTVEKEKNGGRKRGLIIAVGLFPSGVGTLRRRRRKQRRTRKVLLDARNDFTKGEPLTSGGIVRGIYGGLTRLL